MPRNEKAKQILDDIISSFAGNKSKYVKNPSVDFTRERKITFQDVIKAVLSMSGGSLNAELYKYFGRTPDSATTSAFIQQRNKLSDDIFKDLFHAFNNSIEVHNQKCGNSIYFNRPEYLKYSDYNLYAVDGSDLNVAYDEESDTYIAPKKIRKDGMPADGYNQYHLNAIYDLVRKMYVEALLVPKPTANERRAFIDMLKTMELQKKTLFIMDRGYPSWNMLVHFNKKENADYLIRISTSFEKATKGLPNTEFDVDKTITITPSYHLFKQRPEYFYVKARVGNQENREYKERDDIKEWDHSRVETITFRIVRVLLSTGEYETIFTSLPRDKFSMEDIKRLYGMRWGIETSFRELKYIIGAVNLHSRKSEFIKQEIYAKLTMYNFCEFILAAVSAPNNNGNKYKYGINYTMGFRICLDFYRNLVQSDIFYDLVFKYKEAIRPGRSDQRKIRAQTFRGFTYRVAA